MAKHRIRKAWRSMRAQSRLTVAQVSATSLAAITMAIVSARLTSFSSSILIVGVISAISAMASEFYRIVITASAEGTKKAVAPILEGEIHGTSSEGEKDDPAEENVDDAASDPGETSSTQNDEDEAEESKGKSTEGVEGDRKRWRPLLNALLHNQLLQMSVIFLIVALITVGVSYGVARAQGKTEINNNYTTVEQTLTEEEKQEILDQATQAAKEEAAQTGSGQANKDGSNTDQPSTDQPEDTTTENEGLQAEIDALRAENEGLRTSVETLTAQLEAEKVRTDDLATRLAALEALLATQGAQTPTG